MMPPVPRWITLWPAGYVCPQPGGDVAELDSEPAAQPSVGRPKLGVVAREVTLLPRHWEWLAQQRGGASAALRRLVDEARRTTIEQDNERRIKENSYRFMSAIAGALPGYEEATRALFGHDGKLFAERIAHWPADIQVHLAWMTRDAFPSDCGAPTYESQYHWSSLHAFKAQEND